MTATGLMGLVLTDEVYHENRNVVIPYSKQGLQHGLSASTLMVKVSAAGYLPGLAELP